MADLHPCTITKSFIDSSFKGHLRPSISLGIIIMVTWVVVVIAVGTHCSFDV